MKSQIQRIVAFCALALCAQSLPVAAFEINHQAYQAEYKLTGPSGTSTHLMSCDGKGFGRSEMVNSKGSRSVSIIDYKKKEIKILMPGMKKAMTMTLTDDQVSSFGAVSDKMKASAKPLGTRTIQGHPCTGTRYTLEGGGSEDLWNGNDIGGVRVYSKVVTPGMGVSETSLLKYNSAAPPASAFVVPSN